MILFLIKINTAHTWDMALAQPSVAICVLHHLLLPVRKQSFLFPKTLIKPSPPIVCSEDFPNPEYSYSIGLLMYPLPLLPCISSCCFHPTLPIQLCITTFAAQNQIVPLRRHYQPCWPSPFCLLHFSLSESSLVLSFAGDHLPCSHQTRSHPTIHT